MKHSHGARFVQLTQVTLAKSVRPGYEIFMRQVPLVGSGNCLCFSTVSFFLVQLIWVSMMDAFHFFLGGIFNSNISKHLQVLVFSSSHGHCLLSIQRFSATAEKPLVATVMQLVKSWCFLFLLFFSLVPMAYAYAVLNDCLGEGDSIDEQQGMEPKVEEEFRFFAPD